MGKTTTESLRVMAVTTAGVS